MPHRLLIYRIDVFYEPKKCIYHFESLNTDQKCLEILKNVQIYGLNHCTSTPPWNFIKKSIQASSTTSTWYIFQPEYVKKWRIASKRSKLMASSQIGRQRPQKRKDLCLVLNWGTSAYATGVTNLGTHWKWIFNNLWHFFENFVILTTAVLTYNVEAAGEEMGTAYLIF